MHLDQVALPARRRARQDRPREHARLAGDPHRVPAPRARRARRLARHRRCTWRAAARRSCTRCCRADLLPARRLGRYRKTAFRVPGRGVAARPARARAARPAASTGRSTARATSTRDAARACARARRRQRTTTATVLWPLLSLGLWVDRFHGLDVAEPRGRARRRGCSSSRPTSRPRREGSRSLAHRLAAGIERLRTLGRRARRRRARGVRRAQRPARARCGARGASRCRGGAQRRAQRGGAARRARASARRSTLERAHRRQPRRGRDPPRARARARCSTSTPRRSAPGRGWRRSRRARRMRSIAVSAYTAGLVAATGADADARLSLIPNGVDIPADADAPARASARRSLTIARIEERYKGHDVMVRALPLVLATVPDAQWVVIGDGRCARRIEAARARPTASTTRSASSAPSPTSERDAWLRRAHAARDAEPAAGRRGSRARASASSTSRPAPTASRSSPATSAARSTRSSTARAGCSSTRPTPLAVADGDRAPAARRASSRDGWGAAGARARARSSRLAARLSRASRSVLLAQLAAAHEGPLRQPHRRGQRRRALAARPARLRCGATRASRCWRRRPGALRGGGASGSACPRRRRSPARPGASGCTRCTRRGRSPRWRSAAWQVRRAARRAPSRAGARQLDPRRHRPRARAARAAADGRARARLPAARSRSSAATMRLLGVGARRRSSPTRATRRPSCARSRRRRGVEVVHNPVDLERLDPRRIDRARARARLGEAGGGPAAARRRRPAHAVEGTGHRDRGAAPAVRAGRRRPPAARRLGEVRRALHALRQRGLRGAACASASRRPACRSACRWLGEREDVPRGRARARRAAAALLGGAVRARADRGDGARRAGASRPNVGGPAEIVEDGVEGYLLPPVASPRRGRARCAAWPRAPTAAAAMGRAGRERVQREFTTEVHREAMLAVYERALAAAKRA